MSLNNSFCYFWETFNIMRDLNYSYNALLSTKPWKDFRKIIIKHSNYTCKLCGKKYRYGLQVHHKVYRKDTKPWDYSISDVLCLCINCHRGLHVKLSKESRRIPFLDESGNKIDIPNESRCQFCGGSGCKEEFHHILDGLCLYCFGSGVKDSHYFSKLEATRYSYIIYKQWCNYHEDKNGELDSYKFLCSKDVKRWLLELNNKH